MQLLPPRQGSWAGFLVGKCIKNSNSELLLLRIFLATSPCPELSLVSQAQHGWSLGDLQRKLAGSDGGASIAGILPSDSELNRLPESCWGVLLCCGNGLMAFLTSSANPRVLPSRVDALGTGSEPILVWVNLLL